MTLLLDLLTISMHLTYYRNKKRDRVGHCPTLSQDIIQYLITVL
nr:MAG TPA: hypothetical protein [Caudoviricetes sp.]